LASEDKAICGDLENSFIDKNCINSKPLFGNIEKYPLNFIILFLIARFALLAAGLMEQAGNIPIWIWRL